MRGGGFVAVPGDSPQGTAREGRPWFKQTAIVVAVSSLLVTLIFNTIGVWRQVTEANDTRDAAQVSLLTQLDSLVSQAELELTEIGTVKKRCDPYAVYSLRDTDEDARLFAAMHYYDYLSWLLNHERVTLAAARDYWGPGMLDAYRLGTTFHPDKEINEKFPELDQFRQAAETELWPPDPCERRLSR